MMELSGEDDTLALRRLTTTSHCTDYSHVQIVVTVVGWLAARIDSHRLLSFYPRAGNSHYKTTNSRGKLLESKRVSGLEVCL